MCRHFIIFLLSLLFLAGCANETIRGNYRPEAINAFILDKDKLYVVGQYYDFEFTSNDIVKSINALNNPIYKDNILDINIIIEITDQSKVRGYYNVYLDPNKTDQMDKQELQKNGLYEYGAIPTDIYDKVKAINPNWNRNMLYQHRFYSDGRIVKLQNHDEIVQKYGLKAPLIAHTTYYKTKKDVAGWAVGLIALIPTLPVMPVMIVATSPIMIACAIHNGGGCQ